METGCRRSRMFAYKMTDWRGNVNSREAARDLTLPRPVCPLYFSRVTCRRGAGRPPTDDGGQCARSSTTDDCRLTRSALRADRQRSIVLLCHLLRCRPTSHAPPARDCTGVFASDACSQGPLVHLQQQGRTWAISDGRLDCPTCRVDILGRL